MCLWMRPDFVQLLTLVRERCTSKGGKEQAETETMNRKLRSSIETLDSPAIPGVGLVDLAWSAVFAGGFMFLLSVSLSITIYAIWNVSPWKLLLADIVLALAAAGLLGFVRMLAVERTDRVEKQERLRRRVREDSEFDFSNALAEDRRMGREPNASRLDSVARRIMRRYYAQKSMSRAACTEASICTHAEWNRVNGLLQSRGLRTGRLLTPPSYQEALVAWYSGEDTTRSFRYVNGEMVARE